MAGMSRDKCGSAVVAGFLQCVAKLKPKGLKVIGAMAMVRPIPLDNLLGRLYIIWDTAYKLDGTLTFVLIFR